ncbi:ribbon-helix-helix domain-containing protein [Acidipila sp. EB88]|uniref:ribbon-helix-helix domain-containing protein n=1 Tax=Acidipila sp. EB88 TaxID=2305226 RepID=UPI000F5D8C41|nr:ribbon-helix-helix domain-containing protein [Acidipila sp. EB88]RRA50457.1 CopG family transcriptional regulator [Acidipila sp. EB88]
MALLKLKTSTKVQATISIDSETAAKLDHYAAMTHAPADQVIEEALEYLYGKDKDFIAFLQKQGEKSAPVSLKLKQKPVPAKTTNDA